VGMRFPSAQVVRFCDAKAMQLVRALPADGRWRIIIFAGSVGDERGIERLVKVSVLPRNKSKLWMLRYLLTCLAGELPRFREKPSPSLHATKRRYRQFH